MLRINGLKLVNKIGLRQFSNKERGMKDLINIEPSKCQIYISPLSESFVEDNGEWMRPFIKDIKTIVNHYNYRTSGDSIIYNVNEIIRWKITQDWVYNYDIIQITFMAGKIQTHKARLMYERNYSEKYMESNPEFVKTFSDLFRQKEYVV